MTEEQRRHALALCDQILETANRVRADLREAKKVMEEMAEKQDTAPPSGWLGQARP